MKKVLALLLFLASSSAFGQAIWAPVQDYWTRIDGGVVVAGGSGYLTIKDETTAQTARTILTFLGSAITCTDNAGNLATECTVTGGGGAVASDTIWDAAGDLAVGTGADTAAVLAIGTVNKVLTSTGTTAAWAYPEPSGEDLIYIHDDMLCGAASAGTQGAGCFSWAYGITATSWASATTSASATNPGATRCQLNLAADVCGLRGTSSGNIVLMDGYRVRNMVKVSALSTTADHYTVWIGGHDGVHTDTLEPVNGAFFFYTNNDANATPAWQFSVRDDVDENETTCTGATVVADTYAKLEIRYESGVGVHFYHNGTECAGSPINTNLPLTAGSEDFAWLAHKYYMDARAGVTLNVETDYVTLGPTPISR